MNGYGPLIGEANGTRKGSGLVFNDLPTASLWGKQCLRPAADLGDHAISTSSWAVKMRRNMVRG